MFEFLKMKGFSVKDSDVEQAQNELKVVFPEQLKLFWKEIGFGNLSINRTRGCCFKLGQIF